MLLASLIILIIAGAALLLDTALIVAHRPNPLKKDWPLPCPITLVLLGVGLILFGVAGL